MIGSLRVKVRRLEEGGVYMKVNGMVNMKFKKLVIFSFWITNTRFFYQQHEAEICKK